MTVLDKDLVTGEVHNENARYLLGFFPCPDSVEEGAIPAPGMETFPSIDFILSPHLPQQLGPVRGRRCS